VISPPRGIACFALSTMFVNTWFSCPPSPATRLAVAEVYRRRCRSSEPTASAMTGRSPAVDRRITAQGEGEQLVRGRAARPTLRCAWREQVPHPADFRRAVLPGGAEERLGGVDAAETICRRLLKSRDPAGEKAQDSSSGDGSLPPRPSSAP
jgi:hypothetical protein